MNIKIALAILAMSLSGCAVTRHETSTNKVGIVQADVSSKINNMKSGNVITHGGYDKYIDKSFWVDSTPIIISKKEEYPDLKRRFSYGTGIELPLSTICNDLSLATGIYFTLSPELITGVRKISGNIESGMQKEESNSGSGSQGGEIDFLTKYNASWDDISVDEAIKSMSNSLNISWEYSAETNTVKFYKYKTKTYKVHLTGEKVSQTSSMTNASLVSGDGAKVSGTSMSTDVNISSDPWDGLIKKLDVVKSEAGKYSADTSNFTVTLNDTESVHSSFEKMINEINKDSLKEIVFDISLITVSGEQRDLYGVNYEAIYDKALKTVGLTTNRVADPASTALSFIRQSKSSTPDHFEGAKIFVDSLSKLGKAAIVDNFQRTVLNNGVAPIMLSQNRPYLRSISNIRSVGDNNGNNDYNLSSGGNTASLTDLVTGFFLTLRPHVINDNRVLVSMTLNRSSAPSEFESVAIDQYTSLERPVIQDDSDFRQFVISDNETKIIAGSIREDMLVNNKGTVDSDLWWLGGSQENANRRRMMILFVTARIL